MPRWYSWYGQDAFRSDRTSLGLQTGAGEYPLVKALPLLASLSRLGSRMEPVHPHRNRSHPATESSPASVKHWFAG